MLAVQTRNTDLWRWLVAFVGGFGFFGLQRHWARGPHCDAKLDKKPHYGIVFHPLYFAFNFSCSLIHALLSCWSLAIVAKVFGSY